MLLEKNDRNITNMRIAYCVGHIFYRGFCKNIFFKQCAFGVWKLSLEKVQDADIQAKISSLVHISLSQTIIIREGSDTMPFSTGWRVSFCTIFPQHLKNEGKRKKKEGEGK